MDELDSIRNKKIEYLKNKLEEQQKNEQLLQRQIEMVEQEVKKRLSKDAILRYGNIKAANPELGMRVLMILAQIIEKDKSNNEIISDEQFKKLLQLINIQKKQIKIKRA